MSRTPTREQVDSAMRFYAGGRIVKHSVCAVADVPPFGFLAPDHTVDDAVRLAAKALRLSNSLDILVLAWKLRAAAEAKP